MESKAKEEADRIVDMYWDDFCPKNHFPNNNYCECNSLTERQATQCAIIHVEGIIKEINDIEVRYYTEEYSLQKLIHWQEVLTILKEK